MALLTLLAGLKNKGLFKKVVAVHINHGTRPENATEESLVRFWAKRCQVPCQVYHLHFSSLKNFEANAREKRYQIFQKCLGERDRFYTAHHVDDAFEWSLLQSLRGNHGLSLLGIPVVNGRFARPMMAFTRGQISYLVKHYKIPYCDDRSNLNCQHDRNFLRQKVIPLIKQRFPRYLEHFMARGKKLALAYNRWRAVQHGQLTDYPHFLGGALLTTTDNFLGAPEKIRQLVVQYSLAKRGEIYRQIEKLIAATVAGRRGPLTFSGGVQAYIFPRLLVFVPRQNRSAWQQADQALVNSLQKASSTQIPKVSYDLFCRQMAKRPFSFMAFRPSIALLDADAAKRCGQLRAVHPLWPQTTAWALANKIPIQLIAKIRPWRGTAGVYPLAIPYALTEAEE
jgi:tRNA(Ile)-lysidine synthase